MATTSSLLTPEPRRAQAPGVREVTWQPDGTAGAWAEALDGADAVVNLAGESIAEGRWTPARKAALTESRLLSTRSLVAAIDRVAQAPAGSGQQLRPSATTDRAATSRSPRPTSAGDDFLGRLSHEWERAAQAAESGGTRVVLVRTGLVLERDGGALKAMLPPFQFCVGGPLGSGTQDLAVDPSRRLDRADALPPGPPQRARGPSTRPHRCLSPTRSSPARWHA